MGKVGAMFTYNWGEPTHFRSGMNHQVVMCWDSTRPLLIPRIVSGV